MGCRHIDGDWFNHFLDSGEQGLVVIQLYTDIAPSAGGTYICEDGLAKMIKWLYEYPQGTDMRDGPGGATAYDAIKTDCEIFTEVSHKNVCSRRILTRPYLYSAHRQGWRRYSYPSFHGM